MSSSLFSEREESAAAAVFTWRERKNRAHYFPAKKNRNTKPVCVWTLIENGASRGKKNEILRTEIRTEKRSLMECAAKQIR